MKSYRDGSVRQKECFAMYMSVADSGRVGSVNKISSSRVDEKSDLCRTLVYVTVLFLFIKITDSEKQIEYFLIRFDL